MSSTPCPGLQETEEERVAPTAHVHESTLRDTQRWTGIARTWGLPSSLSKTFKEEINTPGESNVMIDTRLAFIVQLYKEFLLIWPSIGAVVASESTFALILFQVGFAWIHVEKEMTLLESSIDLVKALLPLQ